ncbi:MAG: hypothetical protein Q9224_005945 [Gallowayella concinna]
MNGPIAAATVLPIFGKNEKAYNGISLHNTANERPDLLLEHSQDAEQGFSFSPDGRYLAAAVRRDIVRLWDTKTGEVMKTLINCPRIFKLAFSVVGTQLATASQNGLCVWNFSNGLLQHKIKELHDIERMKFSFDGRRLFWTHRFRECMKGPTKYMIKVWDTKTEPSLDGATSHSVERLVGESHAIAVSPCGKYLAYQSQIGVVTIYNTNTKEQREIQYSQLPSRVCLSLAFAPDSKFVALQLSTNKLELWDVTTAQPIQINPTRIVGREYFEFSINGECLETNAGQVLIPYIAQGSSMRSHPRRSYWRYYDGWMMEGSRRMLWLPPDIDLGHYVETENIVHRDGLFAFWDNRLGIRYLGFTQDEVAMEDA